MADAAETVEPKAAETRAQGEAFQAAFREGVDKSVASLSELNAQGKRNLEAVAESAAAAQNGAEALSRQALAYARQSWEENLTAAQSFSRARSLQDLAELQSAWAKTAAETYLAELGKAAEVVSLSVRESLKPINERVTAAIEQLQAAR